jgi:hypothetical protein
LLKGIKSTQNPTINFPLKKDSRHVERIVEDDMEGNEERPPTKPIFLKQIWKKIVCSLYLMQSLSRKEIFTYLMIPSIVDTSHR